MTLFLISAGLLLILVLIILLRPFIFSAQREAISRRQMNAAIYRDELEKLETERSKGILTSADYEIAHAELRQRLFQDTKEADDISVMGSSKRTVLAICIFIVIVSSGFYLYLGDVVRVSQTSVSQPLTQESVEKMVAEFAIKMEQDPSNLKGWAMLARSYRILGRNGEALKAFQRAGTYMDSDPQLMAEYADTLAANANGNLSGKPLQLIQQALKLDPNNVLALWLSGTASYQVGNYSAAVKTWEKLSRLLPPGSEEARAIEGSITEARSKGGMSKLNSSVPSGKNVEGTIQITPELKARVNSGDVVMVIARKPGERMPVAVLRLPVSEFPMTFVLNDALAMSPNTPISGLPEVSIEVRVSKSGMAKPEPGDLISDVRTVRLGATQVQLLINQVRQ